MKPAAPHVPWHEVAGLSAAALAANLAATRAELAGMTGREKSQAIWADAYADARRRGFDVTPGQRLAADGSAYPVPSAADIAAAEVRTAPRFRAPDPHARAVRPINPSLYGLECGLVDDGRGIRRVSDADTTGAAAHVPDHGHGFGPAFEDHGPVSAARAEIVTQAEMEFVGDCVAETGAGISPEQHAKNQKRRRKLREMSAQIVAKLREAGVNALRDDAAKLYAFYIHSRHFEALPAYRRVCFIPEVAAAIRAPKLAALEYWLERNEYARFWTFTAGERVTLPDLESRIDWLHRKLSKLNHGLRRYGVEIVFRSTEFGSLEKKSDSVAEREAGGSISFEDGQPLFHPHAHCVAIAHFGYNPARWQAATQFVRDFWRGPRVRVSRADIAQAAGVSRQVVTIALREGKGIDDDQRARVIRAADALGYYGRRLHCDFGEIIGSAREACKYVTKPGDLLQLSPEHLRALYEIAFRAKLCHPMGSLAREIRIREGHTVEIVRAGPRAEQRAAFGARVDAESGVSPDAWIGTMGRQARTLRQLAAKHRVPLAALVQQNPGLPADVDTPLDYGTKIVIFPGGRCLRRLRRGSRMVWVERLDHNKMARETEAEKAERVSLEDAYDAREACRRAAARGSAPACPSVSVSDPSFIGPCPHAIAPEWLPENAITPPPPHQGAATRVMARIMPAAGPSRVKEPRVIVLSVDGRLDRAAVEAHPLVVGLWQDTVAAWEDGMDTASREAMAAGILDRYSVHTGTPTVQDPGADGPPDPGAAFLEAERKAFEASAALSSGIHF